MSVARVAVQGSQQAIVIVTETSSMSVERVAVQEFLKENVTATETFLTL